MVVIDSAWLAAHPLPVHEPGTDKNGRGRVVIVGGSALVPGALRLTAEAALRTGAGKVRAATIAAAAISLGVTMPEIAVTALPQDQNGEIANDAANNLRGPISQCDTLVFGPGMSTQDGTGTLIQGVLKTPRPDLSLVLDAAGVSGAGRLARVIAGHGGRTILTPHHGEMARLTGMSETAVADAPEETALRVAAEFNALVVLKSHETVIATPAGEMIHYGSDCIGLATGGSGDVLAGAIGGLLSRGADPLTAAAWGVWMHGEAGRILAERIGALGFLARELPGEFPRLMQHGARLPE
ncbi:NAD(P)H-hydrate dehydratase [Sphingobium subterraneum]|uniref:ADP-dependent (S)-NAD(P)H-hydrate dehydratase n=1 Tax=Sphingobium subterraneum TaxID=627688 RepID=A0A841IXF3_9SPHN|nr:NAD(P)H-hydrate dehydratase [Sphingobium subterraneum]MBB6123343.1 hydroxyethylthiazole kinase-like uncharacterized protein yjeF [Sphingobium subterraneum]